MKEKELLVSEILSEFNYTRKVKRHFLKKLFDLDNNKTGKDIFTFIVKKENGEYVINMTGLYKDGFVQLLQYMGICFKKEHNSYLLIRKQSNIIYEISQRDKGLGESIPTPTTLLKS
jgi:hypothetical protein